MGKTKGMINKNSVRKLLIRLSSICDQCGAKIPLGQAHFPKHKDGDFETYCDKCYARYKEDKHGR